MNKLNILLLTTLLFSPLYVFAGNCDYPGQKDSAGRRCGGRAASVIPGGRLGGDGHYTDSEGKPRIYGRDNDPYDNPSYNNPYNNSNSYYENLFDQD